MENKYVYRKHLREPVKYLLGFGLMFIMAFTIGFASMAFSIKNVDKIKMMVTLLGVGAGVIAIISVEFLFLYFILFRRFKRIYVSLTEEGIIYNNSKGEITIPYENIKTLKFPSIKYTGGWLKIIHTNGNIRLTVVLENIGDMTRALKNKLDERNMSTVYNEKKMYKFFKTAEYSDQSWERVYENLRFLIIFMVINLGISAIFLNFITEISVKSLLLGGTIIGNTIPYFISEIIFGRKLAKGATKEDFSVPQRDKSFENKMYKWLFGSYTIIYFILLIILVIL